LGWLGIIACGKVKKKKLFKIKRVAYKATSRYVFHRTKIQEYLTPAAFF